MVKRILQAAALAGVMSLSPVVSARAATVCTTGSLLVCVDFTLAEVGATSNYTLTVKYASSNSGGVLTDFGIDGPSTFNFTAVSVSGSGSFTAGSNCGLQDDACASANAPAPSNGLLVGQTAVLTFSTTNFTGDFSSSFYNAHIQSFTNLPNCSVKLGNGNQFSTTGTGGSFNADAASCGTTSTPEPASMFLLGTGLLGLGGGMVARRRRQSTDA